MANELQGIVVMIRHGLRSMYSATVNQVVTHMDPSASGGMWHLEALGCGWVVQPAFLNVLD